MTFRAPWAALAAWVACAAPAGAQPVDPAIPAPREVLGFDVGDRPANYAEILAYLTALDAASDRVTLGTYGETPTGRKLLLLTISSPANLARRDAIEDELRRLGSGRAGPGDSGTDVPAVVWMGYGIHGDEISGPDAALEVAYRLAAGRDEATLAMLDRLVVHVDPQPNPDGRERNLAHLAAFRRQAPPRDLQDLLHNQPWPQGRGNHYLFDLNRDALHVGQVESRARVAAIARAQVQFLADAHEMGAEDTHLFAIPAAPFNPHLPKEVHATWRDFLAPHAAAFDDAGQSFYTRSWNEVFAPVYFDILPAYHGATPMIYEQASNAGTIVRLPNGRERSYRDSVDNQLRSSFADLATAAANSRELVRRWATARAAAASGGGKSWIVVPQDAYKLERLVRVLRTHGVEVERLAEPVQASGLRSLWGEAGKLALPAGSLRIRSAQPLGALARNLFDFHVPMAPDFLERERRRLDLGYATLLYDVTAWSVPHAYAAAIYSAERSPAGAWEPLAADAPAAALSAAPAPAQFGHVYRDPSLGATARLLAAGVKVRVAVEPFAFGGLEFERGTLVIRNDDQPFEILSALRAEHARSNTQFVPADSARIDDGPDLGGEEFLLLEAPRIAILAGRGTEAASAGALWQLFDAEVGVPVSLLDVDRLDEVDLARYGVVLVPDAPDAGKLAGTLRGASDAIRGWVEAGGTLVSVAGGTLALAELELTANRGRSALMDAYPPAILGRSAGDVLREDFVAAGAASPASDRRPEDRPPWTRPVVGEAARPFLEDGFAPYRMPAKAPTAEEWAGEVASADALKARLPDLLRRYLPHGAYLRVDLKPRHWLGYGAGAALPVIFREADALVAPDGAELVGRFAAPGELHLSGLVWPEAAGYIGGSAYLARESQGAGQVVAFAGDPVFRGYSLGTQRLLMNAVIFGPSFR